MDLRLQWFSSYSVNVVTEKCSSVILSTWPVRLQIEHFCLQRRVLSQNGVLPSGKVGSECYIIIQTNLSCNGFKANNFYFHFLHMMKTQEVTKIQFGSVQFGKLFVTNVRALNPGRSKRFYLSQRQFGSTVGPTQPPTQRVPGFFYGNRAVGEWDLPLTCI
jgi:hypothetical protein